MVHALWGLRKPRHVIDRCGARLFIGIPRDVLANALAGVKALIRPADNVYYEELDAKYTTVRRFLPMLLEHIRFDANASERRPVTAPIRLPSSEATSSARPTRYIAGHCETSRGAPRQSASGQGCP